MFVKARAVNTLPRIRMRFETTAIDLGTALDANAVFTGVDAPQRRRYLDDLPSGFVAEGVNNLAVLEFFRPFLGIRVMTASKIGRNTLQPRTQLLFLMLELSPQTGVRVLWHSRFSLYIHLAM